MSLHPTVYAITCTDPKGWGEYDEIFGPADPRLFESRTEAARAIARMLAGGIWGKHEPPEYGIRETTIEEIVKAADDPDGDEELSVLAEYFDGEFRAFL